MSLETMTKIGTYTVGAGGVSSVSFSNIPQTYTDLVIKISARSTNSSASYPVDNLNVAFNGASAGVTVAQKTLYTYEATGSQITASGGDTYLNSFMIKAAGGTANAFSGGDMYISNYASSNYKAISAESVAEDNSTKAWLMFQAGLSSTTAPITSIQMYALSGDLVQYSTFTLYGVKAMRTAMPQTARGIGGTITRSGGYTYHTFTSSNMFIPTGTISSAEVLVIAGGGSGGGNKSGGGGAGGLLYFPGQSFTSPVPVVIGAGGSGVTSYRGASGTNSFVGSLTAAVGGGAGGGYDGVGTVAAGLTGGSGGGGAGSDAGGQQGAAGSGTTGQGNSGGAGAYITTNTAAGGGGGGAGGAGAAGSGSALAAVGGVGGVGSSAYSAWGLATSTGQNVSSTYYYAGGGGGGTRNGTSGWTGGYGGGGNGSDGGSNTAGTVSTGGGGGASGQTGSTPGASGGSGLVIIRYA